ncbi:MAG TPA: MFS transporter, partial [Planctomycetota bacterium]|nr:MFS transporter [Planctomycetota bacterium]
MSARPPTFVALQHRNYRLLWMGQLLSMSGSLMQSAAVLWHVTLLAPEHKALALGLVGLVRVVPIVVFSMIGGVVADAWDRRRLMLVTQVLMTLCATALAVLTFRGLSSIWPLYVFTALSAAAGSFDSPARQALVPALVPAEHLPNALSLNSLMFQAASVVGPALAGPVIAGFGVGSVYALNAASFLAVIVSLLAMRDIPPREESGPKPEVSRAAAMEGLRFVFRSPLMRSTMLLDFFATFFSSATALLPLFAQDILRVGPHGYGLLYAAPAIGAVATGAAMARWEHKLQRRGRTLLWAVVVYGLATVVFGLSTSFALTFVCLAATGAADTVSMVLRNIIRQLGTPDRLRGRMTSVNMIFFMGGPQLGEFEAGVVARAVGPRFSVASGGLACVVAAIATAL